MQITGMSILGSRFGSGTGAVLKSMDPRLGSPLAPDFCSATPAEVDHAVELADEAFRVWRLSSGAARAKLLRRIAELLETNTAAIIERAGLETALPPARLQGEMGRTNGQLRLFAALVENGSWVDARIDHADPQRQPVPKPDVRSLLRGVGPVAVFSAGNFPLAFSVAGGDTASAFAAGCPVVVKPHQGHLGTSELVGRLIQQAVRELALPEGMFSLLVGSGREVGLALVRHPLIKAMGFTGSRSGGRALMDAAAARPEPIPVYAEMGSINPVFILPGALESRRDAITTGLHASVTLGVGQFCTNPGLIFVPSGTVGDGLVNQLAALLAATAPGTMLTSGICEEYSSGLRSFEKVPGVRKLAGVVAGSGQGGAALFETDAPTFLRESTLMHEVFGPATLVVRYASGASLNELASRMEGQLTATLHATEQELSQNSGLVGWLTEKSGRVLFNGFPTGVEVCHSMNHGGPYPATSDGRSTSVGTRAISRFARPVCYQGFPDAALPPELQEGNPLKITRMVDGHLKT